MICELCNKSRPLLFYIVYSVADVETQAHWCWPCIMVRLKSAAI